jgi:GT2 family glycosyltransferase
MSPVTGGGAEVGPNSVSVVIPTRGEDARLRRGIEAVVDDPVVTEVIVVLDGEAAAEQVPSLLGGLRAHPRVRLVPGVGRGASEARAVGAANATGDVVLFLDDDVVAGPGLASGHLAHHERHAGLVVVGSMPVAADLLARSATARAYACDYVRVCLSYEASSDAVLLDLWSGNLSARRSDCTRIGLANTAFPYGQHEDREFGLRCRAAGLTGIFDRALIGTHHYTRSTRRFLHLARDQVIATRALHALHSDVLGPWTAEQYRSGVPRRFRWLLRTGTPATGEVGGERDGVDLTTLRFVGRAARAAHARRLEDRALTLSRAVVQYAMAQQLASEDAGSPGSRWGGETPDQPAASAAMPATIITKPSAT